MPGNWWAKVLGAAGPGVRCQTTATFALIARSALAMSRLRWLFGLQPLP